MQTKLGIMIEEEVQLSTMLEAQQAKLAKVHFAFSTVMASGYNFIQPMQNVMVELHKVWELLGYIFDLASIEENHDFESDKWLCLERIESNIRKCLLINEHNMKNASYLLILLGVILSDSEQCVKLWT